MRRSTAVITLLTIWIVSACSAGAGTPSPGVTRAPLAASIEPAPTTAAAVTAPPTAAPPVIGTATLTTTGCAFTAAAGTTDGAPSGTGFAISVVNESPDPAGFDLWLLHVDTTYEAWVEIHEQGQAKLDAGEPQGSHFDLVPFADPIDLREAVEPAGTGTLVADASTAGTYALQCWRFPVTGTMRVMAAGPVAGPVAAPAAAGPPARGYHVLVGLDRGIVLFGGQTASPPAGGKDLFDTWEYGSADGWSQIQETGTPWADAAAFDSRSGRAVVFLDGGETSAYDPTTDTWQKHGSTGGPSTTFGMRASYDAESDRTIMIDERRGTWAYDADADAWTESAATTRPPSRLWHAMAYDAGSDRVILFGGTTRSDADLGDTWAYDLNTDTWQEMSPTTSPPARRYAAMAYDPKTDRVILFGGVAGRQEEPLGDTWAYDYDTNTWTGLSPATAPGPRAWHAMAYDPGAGVIVLFGGGRTRDEATAETWLFDPQGGSWTTSISP